MAEAPYTTAFDSDEAAERFWRKLARYAKTAGRAVVERALMLYYAAQDPRTPRWARRVMYGALAYFVLPLDAIPDVVPAIGFTDDLGVLTSALVTMALYVTPQMKTRAQATAARWFG